MKTAMQELIEYIESNEIVYNKDLILKLKELLEKEKEQIIDAWQEAYVTGCVVGSNDYTNENEETDNGAYYYNQTYNQDK
jgi:hemoglobin-like flavoprotein